LANLQQDLKLGRVQLADMVLQEGTTKWIPASMVMAMMQHQKECVRASVAAPSNSNREKPTPLVKTVQMSQGALPTASQDTIPPIACPPAEKPDENPWRRLAHEIATWAQTGRFSHLSSSDVLRVGILCLVVGIILAGIGYFVLARFGAFPSDIANIERVLREDAETTKGANSVAQVVSRMAAINTSRCPNDFRAAFLAHIHAWKMLAEVEKEAIVLKANNESGATFVESLIRGFLGDPFGKANEIIAAGNQVQWKYQAACQEIRLTYNRVEEIAVAHGANLPRK
jgi:hypothetical protein